MLPHFSGPGLGTSDQLEIVDHVVPGAVVMAIAAALVLATRRRRPMPRPPATLLFVAGLTVILAGLWMTTTHIPLMAQAARDEVTWRAAIYHSAPGVALLVLGVLWSVAYWSDPATTPAMER